MSSPGRRAAERPVAARHAGTAEDRGRLARWTAPAPFVRTLTILLVINGAAIAWLTLLGRQITAPDGSIFLWASGLGLNANSQALADPYSGLHVVFGMGLFCFIDGLKPEWPARSKLIVTVAGSALWEAVENTPMVIAMFNDVGAPGAYAGDSMVNSLGDTGFVALGFLFAVLAPRPLTLLVALVLEIGVTYAIADGLVLGTLRVLRIV